MLSTITPARLEAIGDDVLEDVIARKIASTIRGRADRSYLDHLPPGPQMIYATRQVESEVRRGGFEAYLSRGGGHLAAKAIRGYELIGAECHAAIVEDALATFLRHESSPAPYAVLDDVFTQLEPPGSLKVEYVRGNPEEFIESQ